MRSKLGFIELFKLEASVVEEIRNLSERRQSCNPVRNKQGKAWEREKKAGRETLKNRYRGTDVDL